MAAAHLKSILKTPTHQHSKQAKEERDRETALYHAHLIQQRKDIELEILLSTEKLLDLPTSPTSTSDHPSPEDVTTFKTLLRPFQPSDYDALIHERNINDRCGYTLCLNPPLRDGGKGVFRLLGKSGKAKDFKIVPREETEKWCSEICARRALYVRVQLNETPAWERVAVTADIELMDEVKTETNRKEDQLAEDLGNLDLGSGLGSSNTQMMDRKMSATNNVADISIKEKEVTTPASPPSLDIDDLGEKLDSTHLSLVEGYRPTFETHRQRIRHSNSDSDEDNRDGDAVDDDREDSEDWL